MRRSVAEARSTLTLSRILEEALAALVQDASEYGIISLTGGVVACTLTVVLRLMHNPVADALIAPAVIIVAALTLATAAEAFARMSENLQPDAAEAFKTIFVRVAAHLQPWLRLAAMLFVAVMVLRIAGGRIGLWPNIAAGAALFSLSVAYAFWRSLYGIALVAGVRSPRDAVAVSVALVRAARTLVVEAWLCAALPTIAVGTIGVAAGFGAASAGVAALVAVASMPVAAAMLSLIFAEVWRHQEQAQPRRAPAARRPVSIRR